MSYKKPCWKQKKWLMYTIEVKGVFPGVRTILQSMNGSLEGEVKTPLVQWGVKGSSHIPENKEEAVRKSRRYGFILAKRNGWKIDSPKYPEWLIR